MREWSIGERRAITHTTERPADLSDSCGNTLLFPLHPALRANNNIMLKLTLLKLQLTLSARLHSTFFKDSSISLIHFLLVKDSWWIMFHSSSKACKKNLFTISLKSNCQKYQTNKKQTKQTTKSKKGHLYFKTARHKKLFYTGEVQCNWRWDNGMSCLTSIEKPSRAVSDSSFFNRSSILLSDSASFVRRNFPGSNTRGSVS